MGGPDIVVFLAVIDTALRLLRKHEIPSEHFEQLILVDSVEQMTEAAGKLYKAGRISGRMHERLVRAAERGEDARAKENIRAKMREVGRYMGGRKGHPDVQGGLSSLGKGRP